MDNFYLKYFKYKNKYLILRNQLGGSSKAWIPLRIKIMTHDDMKRLSKRKIVATPSNGIFLNMWEALIDEDKQSLIKAFFKQHGWTLGVFINNDGVNKIIFYVAEYLDLLATASEKTSKELLQILSVYNNSPFNKDLIKIAFGDIFGMGYDDSPLETEEGKLVLAKYISLAQI
jgi:hypothetical protein